MSCAIFKKVPLETLNAMQNALNTPEEARTLCLQLEEPSNQDLPCGTCPADIFSTLFDYLETEVCPELREGGEYQELLEFWQDDCDAMDFILMTPSMMKQVRALFQSLDLDIPSLIEELSEDWECSSSDVCSGLQTLIENIKEAEGGALLFILK